MGNTKLAICCETPSREAQAKCLAKRLHLPLANYHTNEFSYLLCLTSERLELRRVASPREKPLFVDFLTGPLGYRLIHGISRKEPRARALGLAHIPELMVIDATVGLGRDALVMARLGCSVVMLERSPIMAVLLRDGLRRAQHSPIPASIIKDRLQLIQVDAITYLDRLPSDDRPNVIYLDPMHPPRTKTAKVKKEMRMLRDIVGPDDDAHILLDFAVVNALQRVVVKRPRLSRPLAGRRPSFNIKGKTIRYDVYIT